MKRLIWLLPLLFIWGCSETPSYPEIETRAEQYLEAQANGNWKYLCQELVPSDRKNIERALGAPCVRALRENKNLGERLRQTSTRINSVERRETSYLVRFESGKLWVTPSGISWSRP